MLIERRDRFLDLKNDMILMCIILPWINTFLYELDICYDEKGVYNECSSVTLLKIYNNKAI